MLTFLLLLGLGLVAAAVYNMRSDKQERDEKLARVRREIARREAASQQTSQNAESEQEK